MHVHEVDELFNSMDPSPFHARALDADAEEFILGSAREIDAAAPIVLVVYLDDAAPLGAEPDLVGEAVREHFARRATQARRDMRQLARRGRRSLVIGLAILGVSLGAGDVVASLFGVRPLAVVIRESMVIGGWVAMWRPMEIFLYELWHRREERRVLDRLGGMDVRVVPTDVLATPA